MKRIIRLLLLLMAGLIAHTHTESPSTTAPTPTPTPPPTPPPTPTPLPTPSPSQSPPPKLPPPRTLRKMLTRAQALSNLNEQSLPSLNQFHLETAELLKRVNAGLLESLNISFNDSYEYEEEDPNCNQRATGELITMILFTIVFIVGLFGNTLVIYVVLRFSKMQTVTNIYILNLAIADECYLIGIPFLLYTMHIGSWKFGEYMCKAYMVSTSVTQFTSSIFLLIMSADRYIAVCHPISSPRYRTPFVSKIVSCIAWLTSVLLILPVILFASTVHNGEHISCNIKWPEAQNNQSGTTFILYTLSLGFATPLTFILGFYCLVIRKLHTVGPKHKSKEKKRSHRKVTKLVLTVITVYILCWLPYWISQVALIYKPPEKCASRLEITVFLLVGCLGYSNSAMNPILYAFLSDNFKKSFMKACTCAARNDVNAQLQLENSLFPKFGGKNSRQTERLLATNKAKQKKAMVARNNNGAGNMPTMTTVTAATTTTGISNTTTICADTASSSVLPPAAAASPANGQTTATTTTAAAALIDDGFLEILPTPTLTPMPTPPTPRSPEIILTAVATPPSSPAAAEAEAEAAAPAETAIDNESGNVAVVNVKPPVLHTDL